MTAESRLTADLRELIERCLAISIRRIRIAGLIN